MEKRHLFLTFEINLCFLSCVDVFVLLDKLAKFSSIYCVSSGRNGFLNSFIYNTTSYIFAANKFSKSRSELDSQLDMSSSLIAAKMSPILLCAILFFFFFFHLLS